MRVVLALLGLLLATSLALPLASATPVERFAVSAAYPGPGARVVLYEDAACTTHELLWQGGWFTVADAAWWVHDATWLAPQATLPSLTSIGSLTNRPANAGLGVVGHAQDLGTQGAQLAQGWPQGEAPGAWALAVVGDEDVCMLSLVSVTSGL